jgi:DNA-binding NarL/FixJ family response regulator
VLIADDSAAIRDSLSALVARLPGVEIVGLATTGLEALDCIRRLKPDVATLDVRMPELNGINVLEVIQKERLGVTVIVLTGAAEEEYQLKCLELGAKFFFHKSTEFEKVIEVLSDLVSQLHDPRVKIRHLP